VELTSNQKGAIAEAAIMKTAVELGIDVYRPAVEGGRYDLIFAAGRRLIRVQCKWAAIYRNAIVIRCYTSRRARSGLVHRAYTADEVDAIAVYCAELDKCLFVPFEAIGASPAIHLRVSPARNNQRRGVRSVDEFEFGARLSEVTAGP
jgi:hypothetical protein